jgi:hypothetical protein
MKISPSSLRLSLSSIHFKTLHLSLSFPDSTNQLINNIAIFNPILKNKPLVLTGIALDISGVNSVHYV